MTLPCNRGLMLLESACRAINCDRSDPAPDQMHCVGLFRLLRHTSGIASAALGLGCLQFCSLP
jgi:hypothetical protein